MELALSEKFAALSHPKRLDVFRLLMRRFPDAVPAGEIAEALGLKPNTASQYFSALTRAGLIAQSRHGVSLHYAADLTAIRALFGDFLGDCCQNRPDLCLAPDDTPLRQFNTLFICTGNSARSIMAETILRKEGKGRFRVFSAGTTPSGAPHPEVLDLLRARDHDLGPLASKSIETFRGENAPRMDFVFTVCDRAANEDYPAWPGQPMSAHWGLPDPARAEGTEAQKKLAFQQAYGLLQNRISAFAQLPFETLDRTSLQHELDGIARLGAET